MSNSYIVAVRGPLPSDLGDKLAEAHAAALQSKHIRQKREGARARQAPSQEAGCGQDSHPTIRS